MIFGRGSDLPHNLQHVLILIAIGVSLSSKEPQANRSPHGQAKKKLICLDGAVEIRDVPQKDFHHDKIFKEYFMGKLNRLPITVDSPFIDAGTAFQQKVWGQIAAIPYGECITYQQLAERAGSPKGARPAGMACGYAQAQRCEKGGEDEQRSGHGDLHYPGGGNDDRAQRVR